MLVSEMGTDLFDWGNATENDDADQNDSPASAPTTEVERAVTGQDDVDQFAVVDIETGPQSDEQLLAQMPEFVPPEPPGTFDPATVKLGNLKDQVKIAAKVEEARQAHARAVESYETTVAQAREQQFADFREKAPLDATTGRVVAIGIRDGDGPRIIDCDGSPDLPAESEAAGIARWWQFASDCLKRQCPIIGHNIHHFDLPFLVRRSWILGVPIPAGVRQGRYWNPLFYDLMKVWSFDGRDLISLDKLAKAFGMNGKVEKVGEVEVSGATFHRLWRENRAVAEAYLKQDLELPAALARRMGVV